jgi:CRISPR-associated endonuclease/helicase Cas3
MDVGLATSAQIESFIAQSPEKSRRPFASWWMSATMQRNWLRSVDTGPRIDTLPQISIAAKARSGHLWDDVKKPVTVEPVDKGKKGDLGGAMASRVLQAWQAAKRPPLTLVVVNTVDRACAIYDALDKALMAGSQKAELRLVHSRFRPQERVTWRTDFLNRSASVPENGRIIVATQVVEAGVDLDASLLITELAPWPSLVQRFGRAARGGGLAPIVVLDPSFADDKEAAPYALDNLAGARDALRKLKDVRPFNLESFEEQLTQDRIEALYPYNPAHLLLRREVDELFDTTPDITGADLDISRFIRSGDERDVTVAWLNVGAKEEPDESVKPCRDELCPVPFLRARKWLCEDNGKLRDKIRAWVWDFIDGRWSLLNGAQIVPGRTLLVASDVGGYDLERGFSPDIKRSVTAVSSAPPTEQDQADAAQDAEALSEFPYKTISTHGSEVAEEARRIATALGLPLRYVEALRIAGLWHDLGKAHPAFQGSIRAADRPFRDDLAKAPDAAWHRAHLYEDANTHERRRGFRHELASALALFAVLAENEPSHPALLGPWGGILGEPPAPTRPPLIGEQALLNALRSPDLFDLVAYLVASHHGKVRARLYAAPADQDYRDNDGRGQPIRGVREGDLLPALALGPGSHIGPLKLSLEPAAIGLSARTGRSWTDRVAALLKQEGPFALAFLEAILRAADVTASRLATADPLLTAKATS